MKNPIKRRGFSKLCPEVGYQNLRITFTTTFIIAHYSDIAIGGRTFVRFITNI